MCVTTGSQIKYLRIQFDLFTKTGRYHLTNILLPRIAVNKVLSVMSKHKKYNFTNNLCFDRKIFQWVQSQKLICTHRTIVTLK